ncbi:rod shape-determining protein MreC [Sphingobacteriaceae bacterium WQ 2009]|uniref:Cell shape-determining protein MreC n=1 Tax=Rhinopithecimicrobium faecis TaxID=2820698 RepID=A0A8T4HAH2_9SPHI|nr:rod shape-determining protein MreC [Sphingobacteriaceae bacterium WQ 2009]
MRALWLFLRRYNAFFWFILFFGFSLVLVVLKNNYQRSSAFNSSNALVGEAYARINSWKSYLLLTETNENLAKENAQLRNNLQYFTTHDTTRMTTVLPKIDSAQVSRYDFQVAKVTNNSVHQKSNYITLDKGLADGVEKGMGVISSNGVVGYVLHVSKHFCTVQSLLHPDTKISVTLDSTDVFGSLVWGNNIDYRLAMVKDIPNHVKVKKGEKVYTSGFSEHFPKGIYVGMVMETGITSGDSFLDLRIILSNDFAKLQQVYIVKDIYAKEKRELEALNQDNG